VPTAVPLPTDDDLAPLIRRCAAGDVSALRAIYRGHAALMLGLAVRMLADRRLAEEAVQDAFVQIWRNAARFEPGMGTGQAWVLGILRFRALDLRASETRRAPPGTMEIDDAQAAGAIAGVPPEPVEERAALKACLGELKDGPRRSIVLAYVEGCSHAEIAERLEQPLGTVKSWILRGLGALRDCLER
jgi:RNA polymerase sigma-70 factor (ECF subfamily)